MSITTLRKALRRLKYGTNGDFPVWLQWWAASGEPSVIAVESSPEGSRVILHWPDGRRGVCAAFTLRVVPVETMSADDFIRDYGNADLWIWCGCHSELVSDHRTMARRKCCEVLEAWIEEPEVESKKTIPAGHRTKPITKRKAAQLLGRKGNPSSVTEWLNQCISDGTIQAEQKTRQSFIFDIREFPESARQQLKPGN